MVNINEETMVNIWLSFVPGSAASTIELILRSCTDLDTLPLNADITLNNKDPDAVNGHGYKQWHPLDKQQLMHPTFEPAANNIFTPIVPMLDFKGKEIFEYISQSYTTEQRFFYLGPSNATSSEFALITQQKTGKNITDFKDAMKSDTGNWSEKELDHWEWREYFSLTIPQWWFPEMQAQWDLAKSLGFYCIDTQDIFDNFKKINLDVIEHIGCNIVDDNSFEQKINQWQHGQNKIWKQWENYIQYKDTILGKAKYDVDLFGDLVLESLIQYHLREVGIELKCDGLNRFPTSGEIKKYYE